MVIHKINPKVALGFTPAEIESMKRSRAAWNASCELAASIQSSRQPMHTGLLLEVTVNFEPAHYNSRCGANIPEAWFAEVVSGLPQPKYGTNSEYAYGSTREEALNSLKASLKQRGYSGHIRIV